MKKVSCISIYAILIIVFCSCSKNNNCEDCREEIHEGRISTHTTKSHSIHQEISPEERELAKEHIINETAPGVSTISIDSEGAKMINEYRASK